MQTVADLVADIYGFQSSRLQSDASARSKGEESGAGADCKIREEGQNESVHSSVSVHQSCEVKCLPHRCRKFRFERWLDVAEQVGREYLRPRATVPNNACVLTSGDRLPPVCCAFHDCTWSLDEVDAAPATVRESVEHPWDRMLQQHIQKEHGDLISAIVARVKGVPK